jgi:threonine aldolase
MREAMARAPVGDDVYGEDPTVNELEALAAEMVGKEAALLVASGTMGNLIGILSHAGRGDEAIAGWDAHAVVHEGGGLAVLGGVLPKTLPTDELGRMDLAAVESAVSPDDPHYARTRLVLVENSYGAKVGAPVPLDYFAGIRAIADRHGLAVHLDGARLFNATTALGIDAPGLTQHVDTVTFCLSKGLCAPVGSILCGSAEQIRQARRIRKVLGGGMRQAGIIAAAGLVALREMVGRLADDHAHARYLAEGLAKLPGLSLDLDRVKTNMVFLTLDESVGLSAPAIAAALAREHNVFVDVTGERAFRLVTHYWLGPTEIDQLLKGFAEILGREPLLEGHNGRSYGSGHRSLSN